MSTESKFEEKLGKKMCYCLTVKDLKSILDDISNDGYEDAHVTFRVGVLADDSNNAVCFPVADIRVVKTQKNLVMFTPAPRIYEVDGVCMPDFDCSVKFNKDSLTLKLVDLQNANHDSNNGEGNVQ